MSDHGRGTPLSDDENEFMVALSFALPARGIKQIDCANRAKMRLLQEAGRAWSAARHDGRGDFFEYSSPEEFGLNFQTYVACALRGGCWWGDETVLRFYRSGDNEAFLRRHCSEAADAALQAAEALQRGFDEPEAR
jgi:hypothetical protein